MVVNLRGLPFKWWWKAMIEERIGDLRPQQ